jgi:hypothetical protein
VPGTDSAGRAASQHRAIESVQRPRYSSEHMFDCLRIADLNEQGAD